jgi:uncharacterized protein (TIGR03435 family)
MISSSSARTPCLLSISRSAGNHHFGLSSYFLDTTPVVDLRGVVDSEGAVLRAVPEQLGLALKAERAPFAVLVVDRLEKLPVGN